MFYEQRSIGFGSQLWSKLFFLFLRPIFKAQVVAKIIYDIAYLISFEFTSCSQYFLSPTPPSYLLVPRSSKQARSNRGENSFRLRLCTPNFNYLEPISNRFGRRSRPRFTSSVRSLGSIRFRRRPISMPLFFPSADAG